MARIKKIMRMDEEVKVPTGGETEREREREREGEGGGRRRGRGGRIG